ATLRKHARPGMNVLDVGANIGVHTFLLSQLVGSTGHVTAVEPNSENAPLIILGQLRNNISNITLLPVALDQERGWAHFSPHQGSNGGLIAATVVSVSAGAGTVVPTLQLDDIAGERVDLIKIDVEGAEWRALAGSKVLERDRP